MNECPCDSEKTVDPQCCAAGMCAREDEAMETTATTMREGDVYRWRYRAPGDDRAYGRYHCCSCIAIFTKGWLRDTYWALSGDGRSFGVDDLHALELTRLGNLDELEKKPKYEADYYDAEDIVDLTHSNGGTFYLRKGAKRSAAKMLQVATQKLEQAQSDERMAIYKADQLRTAIARIEAGDTSGGFY